MGIYKKNRIILIATLLLVFVSIFYYLRGNHVQTDGILVNINSVPGDISIIVNDKETKSSKLYLPPGTHTIEAKKEGFKTSSKTINIVYGNDPVHLYFLMLPVSESATEWYNSNRNEYLKLEKIAGENDQAEGVAFSTNNPIVKLLPYRSLLFNIDYSLTNDKKGIILHIKADNSTDRSLAISQIRNWGYDPSDFEILFTNFANPLSPHLEGAL